MDDGPGPRMAWASGVSLSVEATALAEEKLAGLFSTALMSSWRLMSHRPSMGLKVTGASFRSRAKNG